MAENVHTEIRLKPGETGAERMAEIIVAPDARAAFLHYNLARRLFAQRDGSNDQRPSFEVIMAELGKQQDSIAAGDLKRASDMLASQAQLLDALFSDFTHRALENAGTYPEAMQRYMTLALKAQTQSRTALEGLIRLHQPREQIVRHVHVHEGGQAVVADQIHHHSPGDQNAELTHQPHACVPALPGADPLGNEVPLPSGGRKEALPDARRRGRKRGTTGQPERAEARDEVGGDTTSS